MLYSRIAESLQAISQSTPAKKAQIAACLLREASPDMLCPVVRLLLGELWPRWEEWEMGIGPEAVAAALAEVSRLSMKEMAGLREGERDMGIVAQMALFQKGQNSLSSEPLHARSVYDVLRQVSRQSGRESEQRKSSLLRGLFLQASPLEGRFIARTALRSMKAGIGRRTMISALAMALGHKPSEISQAFGLLPDMGLVAEAAGKGELEKIAMRPSIPVGFMIFGRCREEDAPGLSSNTSAMNGPALLPVYPGLRVQVHKSNRDVSIFTSRLRPIGSAFRSFEDIDADFILDAYLTGFQRAEAGFESSRICSHREILGYINRRRLTRKSSLSVSLLAYDILYLNGESLCSLPYLERRKSLIALLGPPRSIPFSGISSVEEQTAGGDAAGLLPEIRKAGGKALQVRQPHGLYLPGEAGRGDCIIR